MFGVDLKISLKEKKTFFMSNIEFINNTIFLRCKHMLMYGESMVYFES